jgi:ABC-type glycerol-3-phosphate transport system permease component
MTLALRWATMAMLLIIAAITFTPLIWLLAASLKAPEDLFSYTFFSPNPSLKNFYDLFTQVDFLRFVANSTFVACAGVIIQLFFSSLAGYALAKYAFKGKQAITILMLATLLIQDFGFGEVFQNGFGALAIVADVKRRRLAPALNARDS